MIILLALVIGGVVFAVKGCSDDSDSSSKSSKSSSESKDEKDSSDDSDDSDDDDGEDEKEEKKAKKSGNDYTDPVDSLMRGIEEQDGAIMLSAFSAGTIEVLEYQSGYTQSELEDYLEEMFVEAMGMDIKPGAYQVDYIIEYEEDLTSSEVAEIQDEFDYEGVDEEIEEAKYLELTMIVGMEDVTDETYEDGMTLQVVKIDGMWYVDPTSM